MTELRAVLYEREKKKQRAARRNGKAVGVLLQIKRGTPENKERPSKGEVLLTPLALYNTKFRFVKFDRAFFEKYFYSFSH